MLTRVDAAALAAGACACNFEEPRHVRRDPHRCQYIAYAYGRRLPDSMQRWVAEDLAAQGAVRRHMIRMAIPPFLVLAPFWLLPASLYVHLEMTVPIYAWALLVALRTEQDLAQASVGAAWA